MGHICYYATEGDEKVVFTGDTLFIGGAGRFFEGSPSDMQMSLGAKLAKLPSETLVYCGHEVHKCQNVPSDWLSCKQTHVVLGSLVRDEILTSGVEHCCVSRVRKITCFRIGCCTTLTFPRGTQRLSQNRRT